MNGVIPTARDGHSACIIDNAMYIFGGFEGRNQFIRQDVHKLDLESMEWSYVRTRVSIICILCLFAYTVFILLKFIF